MFVSLVETRLSNYQPDSILQLCDYAIFRNDRESNGGGCLLAVNKKYPATRVQTHIECKILAVDLLHSSVILRVIVCYIPHINDINYLNKFFHQVHELITHTKQYIILGDFNFPDINWSTLEFPNTAPYQALLDFIKLLQPVSQLINFLTRGSKILDLFLTNTETLFKDIQSLPPLANSDHIVITGKFQFKCVLSRTEIKVFKNFKDADYNLLGNHICDQLNLL